LSIFEIIKDGDKEEEREKEHKDIMPKEAGKVYHIGRKSKKESS
jgi:1,2-phenylacetyl-CoA epoxidase PaaB subunit